MLFIKEETYSFKEFNQILNEKKYTKEERLMKQYANECGTNLIILADYLTDKELAEYRKLDREVGIMMKDKRTGKLLITLTACLAYCNPVIADVGQASAKIAQAGGQLMSLCQTIGYWACLIMCAIEIIKALMNGDTKSISRIIAKYLLGFGALFFLPWIFDMIKDIFS